VECVNHPGIEPAARCVSCGVHLCAACAVERDGKYYCSNCTPRFFRSGDLQLQRAYTYMFDDPEWIKKVVIGALMVLGSVLVIPLFILLGYEVEVIRMVAAGQDRRLPDWNDWGAKLETGAKLAVVMLIYALPMLALMAGFYIPLIVQAVSRDGNSTGMWYTPFFFGFGVLVFFLSLLYRLVMPAYTVRFARTGSIKSGLQFGEVARMIRANIGAYLLVMALLFANGYLVSLGWIACCVGVFFTSFYISLVNAHLFGQIARISPQPD